MKICILTAGIGSRMGPVDKNVNKALLPIRGKAIISHIIEYFNLDDEFVIGLGYMGQQVRDYLTVAYPDRLFHFINIDKFEGDGSGPGYSLLCCKNFLLDPFYFIPCDCLFDSDFRSVPNGNWIGTKAVDPKESENYCNAKVRDGIVVEIKDKKKCSSDFVAFTGFLYVKDFEIFWKNLEDTQMIDGEHQISNGLKGLMDGPGLFGVEMNWTDLGDIKKYRNEKKKEYDYNFEKTDEFIYFVNDQVIKFFADKKNVSDRVKRSRIKPDVFPKVTGRGEQFFSYPFLKGETFYNNGDYNLFQILLKWLDEKLWDQKNINPEKMKKLCKKFYKEKTLKRFEIFNSLYPNYCFPEKINNYKVLPLPKLLQEIKWEKLYGGIPSFIHGDLQFDNIIINQDLKNFMLIDWRQDFGGESEFGDLYYDIAKLYGGIILNYDLIKKGLFKISQGKSEVIMDFAQRNMTEKYIEILEKFIESKNLELDRVLLLVGLIYINMAPLHHEPFNFLLIALGTQILNNINLKDK